VDQVLCPGIGFAPKQVKLLPIVYAFSRVRSDARRGGAAPVVLDGQAGWHGQRLVAGRAVGVDDVRELLATERLLPQERRRKGVERGAVVAQYGARALMRLSPRRSA